MRSLVVAVIVAGCASDPAPTELAGRYGVTVFGVSETSCDALPVPSTHAAFDLIEDWRGGWTFRWCDGSRCEPAGAFALMRREGDELHVVDPFAIHGDDFGNNTVTCIQGYWKQEVTRVGAAEVRYDVSRHVLEHAWSADCTEATAIATVGDGNCVSRMIVAGQLGDERFVVP